MQILSDSGVYAAGGTIVFFCFLFYAKIFSNISIALSAGGAIMSGGWGYLIGFISFDIILLVGMGFVITSGLIGFYSIKSSRKMKL